MDHSSSTPEMALDVIHPNCLNIPFSLVYRHGVDKNRSISIKKTSKEPAPLDLVSSKSGESASTTFCLQPIVMPCPFILPNSNVSKLSQQHMDAIRWLWHDIFESYLGGIMSASLKDNFLQIPNFLYGLCLSKLVYKCLILCSPSRIRCWAQFLRKWAPLMRMATLTSESDSQISLSTQNVLSQGGTLITTCSIAINHLSQLSPSEPPADADPSIDHTLWDVLILDQSLQSIDMPMLLQSLQIPSYVRLLLSNVAFDKCADVLLDIINLLHRGARGLKKIDTSLSLVTAMSKYYWQSGNMLTTTLISPKKEKPVLAIHSTNKNIQKDPPPCQPLTPSNIKMKLPKPLPIMDQNLQNRENLSNNETLCEIQSPISISGDESPIEISPCRQELDGNDLVLPSIQPFDCEVPIMSLSRFLKIRTSLAQALYAHFNQIIFDLKLPTDMILVWRKMNNSAGIFKMIPAPLSVTVENSLTPSQRKQNRIPSITLSKTFLSDYSRLSNTLAHEMCHAAVCLIDKSFNESHGPIWKKWTRIVHARTNHNITVTTHHRYD